MSCTEIVSDGEVIGHICGGGVVERTKARAKRLWCFKCRKRNLHDLMVISAMYYDPEFFRQCRVCHESHTGFPS